MKKFTYPLFAALIGFSSLVSANVITENETKITEDGQTYTGSTLDLSAYVGQSVTLDLLAAGDYGANDTGESFLFFMNDILIARWDDETAQESIQAPFDPNNITLAKNFYTLNGVFNMDTSIADTNYNTFGEAWNSTLENTPSVVTFSWVNEFDFQEGNGVTFLDYGDERVVYSVSAVPEPSTYALMLAGLGLVGFMASRRKQA